MFTYYGKLIGIYKKTNTKIRVITLVKGQVILHFYYKIKFKINFCIFNLDGDCYCQMTLTKFI